jgi:hypothetical protein
MMERGSLATVGALELLGLYDAVLTELRSREILRSTNNPVADYAEWLASRALGLLLQPKSTAGFDGICREGIRYEVKSRRCTRHNESVQLSAIRKLDDCHFDYLIGIIFRADFTVDYAGKVPHEVVVERARYRTHTNAWILHFKRHLLDDARVEDITSLIVAASATPLLSTSPGVVR